MGFVTTLIISEPKTRISAGTAEREGKVADFAARLGPLPHWLRETLIFLYSAIVCPFVDFFVRYRLHGLTLLAFIGLFRLSDIAMGVILTHDIPDDPGRLHVRSVRGMPLFTH